MPDLTPDGYLIVPWRWIQRLGLPDHLLCTYQLILTLAAWRGLALRTIDEHLLGLRRRDLIRNDPLYHGPLLMLVPVDPETAVRAMQGAEDPAATREGSPSAAPPSHDVASLSPPAATGDAPPSQSAAPHSHRLASRSHPAASPPQSAASHPCDEPQPQPSGASALASFKLEPIRKGTEKEPQEQADTNAGHQNDDDETRAIVRRLVDAGVYETLAWQLARAQWVTLALVDEWIAVLKRRKKVRKLGGLLFALLSDPDRCLPGPRGARAAATAAPAVPSPPPDDPLDDLVDADAADADDVDGWDDVDVDDPIPDDPADDEEWQAVLDHLRQSIGDERVDLWFAGSRVLSRDDLAIIIGVRTPRAADWLAAYHLSDVQAALHAVTGEHPAIQFVVARGP